jgi:hypothetical protein
MAAKRAEVSKAKGRESQVVGAEPSHRSPIATKKGTWSIADDIYLVSLVKKEGPLWTKHAGRLTNKTPKQVREIYTQHLDPRLKKSPMRAKEGEKIKSLVDQVGHQWVLIARLISGRSDNDVKN